MCEWDPCQVDKLGSCLRDGNSRGSIPLKHGAQSKFGSGKPMAESSAARNRVNGNQRPLFSPVLEVLDEHGLLKVGLTSYESQCQRA